MRVAPIGVDDGTGDEQARVSAATTHAHPEGQAGAIAVAVVSAWASRQTGGWAGVGKGLLDVVWEPTPAGETRSGIERTLWVDLSLHVTSEVQTLGIGSQTTSQDKVLFALWYAARHIGNYAEAGPA
jgi:ADP-ribosylglycohydrolase